LTSCRFQSQRKMHRMRRANGLVALLLTSRTKPQCDASRVRNSWSPRSTCNNVHLASRFQMACVNHLVVIKWRPTRKCTIQCNAQQPIREGINAPKRSGRRCTSLSAQSPVGSVVVQKLCCARCPADVEGGRLSAPHIQFLRRPR
jgi:hypothetical protein